MKSSQLFKLFILTILIVFGVFNNAISQGVSFSYLIPKNGFLSAPVSPFSIRGIGIGGIVGIETGATLYSIPGLSMSGLPFDSKKPLTGQSWSVLIPGQATVTLPFSAIQVKLLAGGFFIWHMNTRLNKGNLDREIASYEGWDIANSRLKMGNKPGFGLIGGVGFEFKINNKFSLTSEIQYLNGHTESSLTGTYAGGNIGGLITSKEASFESSKTNIEGIELSIGVKF